jgi:zinc transport system ATP-binding protein
MTVAGHATATLPSTPRPAAPAAGQPPLLVAARGLGVKREGRWLVRHVDLALHQGAGIRALLGLIRPDAGTVERARGLAVGYVPQRLTLDWTLPLTVRRLMTLTGRHPRADIERALAQVGIGHLADARVQTLSGGEFQRALLARAIIRRPQLLVLDEPVQNVDFSGEIALYELIRGLRDELGCGILLISHDLHIVMAHTDTVLCLNGHVCCHGTPQAVTESPEYRRLFGVRASGTLAVYRHHHDHIHRADGSVVHLPPPEES